MRFSLTTRTLLSYSNHIEGKSVAYPIGILSFQMSLVSLGTKSEISVAM